MAETITIRTGAATDVIKVIEAGPQGPQGQGVPVGGSTGQVLRKVSGTNYDTEWAAAGSGSGSVTSVALAGTGLSISGSPVTTSGTITANVSYGTTSGTACQGNDSRLSDSRTPSSHAHGNITNDGKIGTSANLAVRTGLSGIVEAGTLEQSSINSSLGNGTLEEDLAQLDGAISSHTHSAATTSVAGFFSAADKTKIDSFTQLPAKVEVFTANDTWTKPTGAKMVHYLLIGGGGGGGAGRRSLQGNTLGGGGGGAGGGITAGYVDPAFLSSTETITIGAGGTGAVDSADNTTGASGTAGGESSFGSFIKARGGSAGGGGSSSGGSAGAATTLASLFYGTNASTAAGAIGAASSAAPSNAAASVYLPTGGGGGGARSSSTNGVGSKGGDIGQTNTGITSAPAIAAGTNGPAGIRSQSSWAGTGGGGGSMSSDNAVHTGFSGGNGGLYGGGGGGGSGAVNAAGGSTAGGAGGAGIVIVTTFF